MTNFTSWSSKTYLWTAMLVFFAITCLLTLKDIDKDYIMAAFALTGQLVAGLLTYINSMRSKDASQESKLNSDNSDAGSDQRV